MKTVNSLTTLRTWKGDITAKIQNIIYFTTENEIEGF